MMGLDRGVVEEEEEETAASSVGSRVISPENVLRAEAEAEGVAGGEVLSRNIHFCFVSICTTHYVLFC